ncbi:fungal specific transcription factor domain-containing protein [Sarocladium implicatum]|nr:fungal specific transcription factor domain-containing protein [Sarocladium implicatum]
MDTQPARRPGPGHACETCRSRAKDAMRPGSTQMRCTRLNLPCGYSSVSQTRRTRDDQLHELRERLARTEAQLARANIREPPSPSRSRLPSTDPTTVQQPIGTTLGKSNPASSNYSPGSKYDDLTTATIPGPTSQIAPQTLISADHLNERPFGEIISAITPSSSAMIDIDMINVGLGFHSDHDWSSHLPAFEPSMESLDQLANQPRSLNNEGWTIPETDLAVLQDCYFNSIYFSFPFINRDRFKAESSSRSLTIDVLGHALALAGCAHSASHYDQKPKCYSTAREHAERCERDGQIDNINLLQALVLIGRFEAMEGRLENSWMTLGRAAMLSKLMQLPQMDQPDTDAEDARAEGTGDVLLEERRRTFWALYILQCFLRTRTGWACTLGDTEVSLPYPLDPNDSHANSRCVTELSDPPTVTRCQPRRWTQCILVLLLSGEEDRRPSCPPKAAPQCRFHPRGPRVGNTAQRKARLTILNGGRKSATRYSSGLPNINCCAPEPAVTRRARKRYHRSASHVCRVATYDGLESFSSGACPQRECRQGERCCSIVKIAVRRARPYRRVGGALASECRAYRVEASGMGAQCQIFDDVIIHRVRHPRLDRDTRYLTTTRQPRLGPLRPRDEPRFTLNRSSPVAPFRCKPAGTVMSNRYAPSVLNGLAHSGSHHNTADGWSLPPHVRRVRSVSSILNAEFLKTLPEGNIHTDHGRTQPDRPTYASERRIGDGI